VLLITVLVQFDALKLTQLLLVCVPTSTYIVRISWMAIAVVMPLWFAVTQLFGLTFEDFVIQKRNQFLFIALYYYCGSCQMNW
jgi:hypothetical protein